MNLKAEVFEKKQKDRDYKLYHEKYIQLQHKLSLLTNEKVSLNE